LVRRSPWLYFHTVHGHHNKNYYFSAGHSIYKPGGIKGEFDSLKKLRQDMFPEIKEWQVTISVIREATNITD
jgi:hypothetical protein